MTIRQQIRQAAAARIADQMPGQFAEVSVARRDRIPGGNLPACIVYTDSEAIAPITVQSPRLLERSVELSIRIAVRADGSGTPDDALDDLAAGVEAALGTSNMLGIAALRDLRPTAWSVEAEEDGADSAYLVGTLAYLALYEADEPI